MPSAEYRALQALKKPDRSKCGDMWLCRRLGIVKVFTGHKNGQRRHPRPTSFHLYHWAKPDLTARPCDWRDNDANATSYDPALGQTAGEQYEYLGNIFEMLTYSALTGKPEPRLPLWMIKETD